MSVLAVLRYWVHLFGSAASTGEDTVNRSAFPQEIAFATTGIVGVLRGGGDVRIAMLIDILPLWCFTLPTLVLLGLVLHAPIAIFCFVMATESVLKVPFGLYRIHSGKWIHDVTRDLGQ